MGFRVGPHHYLPKGRYCTLGFTNSLHLYLPPIYVVEKIAAGEFDLVYVTPERFFGWREGGMSTLSGQENNSQSTTMLNPK